jgi:hypothetical protein
MPLHAWEKVPSGMYHSFHQAWAVMLSIHLNESRLPKGFGAFVEMRKGPLETDVLAIDFFPESRPRLQSDGGIMTMQRPKASLVRQSAPEYYSQKADRIVVKYKTKRIVAVIEIVSPGNKKSGGSVREFVRKAAKYVDDGVQLLVIDPFPPGRHDPAGMHKAVWDEISVEEPFRFPAGRDRLAFSYEIGMAKTAFIESLAVGSSVPAMPLFLQAGYHVMVDLESTYEAAARGIPEEVRTMLAAPRKPAGKRAR